MKRRGLIVLGIGLAAAGVAFSSQACDFLTSILGPPSVELEESYGKSAGKAHVSHAKLDTVLHAFVTAQGLVDYAGLAKASAELDGYIADIAKAPWKDLGRDAKLALLINAYNAFTLRLILDHWPVASIKDIPSAERWDAVRWRIGPLKLSLTQVEHEYLRKRFKEPRIHFAINCASIGCPPLRREAYDPARIDEQLQQQAVRVHTSPSRWFRLEGDTLHLTQLYRWFGGDFVQVAGSTLGFAKRFSKELALRVDAGEPPRVAWLDYDWSINDAAK